MRRWCAFALLFMVLLAGCGGFEIALPVDATPTTLPTPGTLEEEPAGQKVFSGICSYVWTSRSLPEVNDVLAKAIQDAEILNVEVEAFAYGENCVDLVSNYVVSFTPRQTNYRVNVQVNSIEDRRAMGDWMMRISNLLENTPGSVEPDTEPGIVEVMFQDDSYNLQLSLPIPKVREHLEQGLRGSALFDALEHDQQQ